MRYFIFVFFIFLGFVPEGHAAQQAYINGHVLTMNASEMRAEAVLVEGGIIKAVGSNKAVLARLKFGSEVIDLKGKTLMPGFVDAHSHYPGSGLSEIGVNLNSPPAGNITTVQQALAALKQKARTLPPGKWLYADGYDDTLLKTPRLLNRQDLDQVSTEHPIYVSHISGHTGMANSLALQKMGWDSTTPDPPGGHFERNTLGNLTGIMIETPSDNMKIEALQGPVWEKMAVISKANHDYLSQGVTTAQSGATPHILVKALSWMSRLGLVPMRLVVYPMVDNGTHWAQEKINYQVDETDFFKVGAVKLFTDGSIQAYSGLLKEPYLTVPSGYSNTHRGHQRVSLSELTEQWLILHQAGKQVAIHANGDAAIERVIQAYQKVQQQFYRADMRPIVIHSQLPTETHLKQMKRLGLTSSFFNAHVFYWGDRHRKLFLGPERAARLNPLKSAIENALPFSLHLDTPVVPMEPMMMLWTATERQTRSGYVLGPEQRISRAQALKAMTSIPAWQNHWDHHIGSLEVGKWADMVVLSENPLTFPNPLEIKVLRTIVGGKQVYLAHE